MKIFQTNYHFGGLNPSSQDAPSVDRRRSFAPADCPRLIVKVGSSLLVGHDGKLRYSWLASLLDDVAALVHAGQEIAVVTSGAVALGARTLQLRRGGRTTLDDAQAAAAVGQIMLLQAYAELFRARDCIAAQLLLTLDDLEDRQRYLNVSTTLERLFQNGAVPVINENDSVATNEIKFGDNDRLAARVAQAAFANGIILLSDVEGLFTADPALINGAKLVRIVDDLAKAAAMAGSGSRSGLGSGGMRSKLMAAKIAHQTGVPLAIALGTQAHPLKRFIDSGHGTLILPATAVTSGKKSWLLGRLTVAGSIHVDTGAEIALRAGKSLLPSGVIEVFGKFDAGAVVEVVCGERTIARGLANYASPEARSIAGLRTDQLEACLGYPPRRTFIHANHLVLL